MVGWQIEILIEVMNYTFFRVARTRFYFAFKII